MVTSLYSEIWQTGFDYQFFLLLAVWPQSSNLTTLSLSFAIHILRMKQMIQLCSVRFCKKQMPRWDVSEETAGRECGKRLQEARNAVKPPGRLNSCKKKKKERERKERKDLRWQGHSKKVLAKFWGVPKSPSTVRNHASPRKGPASIPLMRWVTGGNSSYKVSSLPNTEMDSVSSGGGPQPIPPLAVRAAHSQALLSPIPTSKGRISLHKTS